MPAKQRTSLFLIIHFFALLIGLHLSPTSRKTRSCRHQESPHCPCSLSCRPRRPSGPARPVAVRPASTTWPRSHQAPQHPAIAPILKLHLILQLLHTRGSTLRTQAEPSARRPARCYIHPEVSLPQPCPDVQRPGCPSFLIASSSGVFDYSRGFTPARRATGMALPANDDDEHSGHHAGHATQQLLTAHEWQVTASPMDTTSGCSCGSVITTRLSQLGGAIL